MNNFKSFGIPTIPKGFKGDKIKMSKILNREIVVHDYKLEDSKIYKDRGTGKCLHLQISILGDDHIIFTSSGPLIDAIQQVPKDKFPFQTTIIQESERFIFT